MAKIAFYAPMKSPRHEVPSGDREMARALVAALVDPAQGRMPELVGELRIYDGKGDPETQADLIQKADLEATRLIREGQHGRWSHFVTYHNYYKAPDLIGPKVSAALNLPYIQIEASRSPKRLSGPWAEFAAKAEAASDQADVIFHLTNRDLPALELARPPHQKLVRLRPFLNLSRLPPAPLSGKIPGDILTVAMMREGDKLASFQRMAATLSQLNTDDWRLHIVGDGRAKTQVQALFSPFGERVIFHGRLAGAELQALYDQASIFFWPGVNEAFGMVYLEAQAAGLAIVAENRPGLRDIMAPDAGLADPEEIETSARLLDHYLSNDQARMARWHIGRQHVADHHLLINATAELGRILQRLTAKGSH